MASRPSRPPTPAAAAVAAASVERHVATEERVGVEQAEHDVGVGDRRLGAATAVGGRARLGAGRLRPDLQQAELVDAGERSAAGTDLDEVDRRHGAREAGALLEAVGAGDLEHVGQFGLAAGR